MVYYTNSDTLIQNRIGFIKGSALFHSGNDLLVIFCILSRQWKDGPVMKDQYTNYMTGMRSSGKDLSLIE